MSFAFMTSILGVGISAYSPGAHFCFLLLVRLRKRRIEAGHDPHHHHHHGSTLVHHNVPLVHRTGYEEDEIDDDEEEYSLKGSWVRFEDGENKSTTTAETLKIKHKPKKL